jgi:hypothetical protein
MLEFEILLFAGLAMISVLFREGRLAGLLLIVLWAHAALVSARHVPLYAIVAAPVCAGEASLIWSRWTAGFSRRSIAGLVRDCLRDFSAAPARTSLWAPAVLLGLSFVPWDGPRDFPANRFPVAALDRNRRVIAPATGAPPRILTSDQWGDYLIYRLYPDERVFVDGRSDFYGPVIGRQYLELLNAAPNWKSIVVAYGFDVALLPAEWPLGQLMRLDPGWRVRYQDRQAILLERNRDTRLNKKPDPTERINGGRND